MLGRSTIFFPLVLAILLALITFWINFTVEQSGTKIDGRTRHDPDYTLNNFVNTHTDLTGKLHYVIAATEMVHFPDDDSTVLQRPRFTEFTINKPYMQIEGLRGYVSSNGEEVEMIDNVKVVRQAFEGKGEMQVLTEKLTIFPNQDLVKTNSPVVIKQAPKTVITATGMIYDKNSRTVQLLSKVRVHYERPTDIEPKTAKPSSAQINTSPTANPKHDIRSKPTTTLKMTSKKKPLKNQLRTKNG
jgi:lipopolysaccharide export system protein LptC